jgi:hypothetical protein
MFQRSAEKSAHVFNLNFLLDEVMGTWDSHRLDWDAFERNAEFQPLNIIASSVQPLEPVILRRGDHYRTLDQLLKCIRASMTVPGITGRPLSVSTGSNISTIEPNTPHYLKHAANDTSFRRAMRKFQKIVISAGYNSTSAISRVWQDEADEIRKDLQQHHRRDHADGKNGSSSRLLVDALMCEPIPYRSACMDNATHVIILRTRPDPAITLGKGPGLYERMIAARFFRQYGESEAATWLLDLQHQRIYAEDLLLTNEASKGPLDGVAVCVAPDQYQSRYSSTDQGLEFMTQTRNVHILPIAPVKQAASASLKSGPGNMDASSEVGQLELDRALILQGMREGAARVFELFGPVMNLRQETIDDLMETILPITTLQTSLSLDEYRRNNRGPVEEASFPKHA